MWVSCVAVVAALACFACGSSVNQTSPAACDAGASGQDPGMADTGSVPVAPVLQCTGATEAITLEMPCLLGMGPVYAFECNSNAGKLAFQIPSSDLLASVGKPLAFNAILNPGSLGKSLTGTLTLYQLNLSQRALVGRLTDTTLSLGTDNNCTLADGLFWAVPGSFE